MRLRDLAELPLRLPAKAHDPLFRDFALDACRAAGFEPRLGRPAGTVTDTVIELANGSPAWTLAYADAVPAPVAHDPGVAVVPLDPPLIACGCLVVPATRTAACVAGLRAAFAAGPPGR